jgi:hypothetical protein
VKDPKEQRVVAVVRLMYFVKRLPMRDIVGELRDMGIVNRRGKAFGLSRIFEMIHDNNRTPREAATPRRR